MIHIDIDNAVLLCHKISDVSDKLNTPVDEDIESFKNRTYYVERLNASMYEPIIKKIYLTDSELKSISNFI